MPTIAELREQRGLSQRALGKALGVTSQTVLYWERGDRLPTLPHLRALARFFGVRMDDVALPEPPEDDDAPGG